MALPFSTRCTLQILGQSSSQEAQNAYSLAIKALVSGAPDDIETAASALRRVQGEKIQVSGRLPTSCESGSFQNLHDAARESAVTHLSESGVTIPFATSEEIAFQQRRSNVQAGMFLGVAVSVIITVVVGVACLRRNSCASN
tara:strand:+ start:610 stop:1035 length:426 start_codon:yes stop_codon:yes gene_type:complete